MGKFNLNDYTNDFLWFSYFGVTKGEVVRGLKSNNENSKLKEELKRVCIQRAYRDLCRTLDFTYSDDALKKEKIETKTNFNKLKSDFKKCIDKYLAERIRIVLNDCSDFDKWHRKTCKEIISRANSCEKYGFKLFKESFKYGHAQKWVNMTLKNMLVMGLITDEIIISNLHVPVDEMIIKSVWEFDGISLPLIKVKNETRGKYSTDKLMSWSQWNEDDYKKFQKDLKNNEKVKAYGAPIIWEGQAWIAQAKLEKDKENKKDEQ